MTIMSNNKSTQSPTEESCEFIKRNDCRAQYHYDAPIPTNNSYKHRGSGSFEIYNESMTRPTYCPNK